MWVQGPKTFFKDNINTILALNKKKHKTYLRKLSVEFLERSKKKDNSQL